MTYVDGRVTVELRDLPAEATPRIVLHPNPVSGAENSLLRASGYVGRGTVEVFDPLGRRVRASAVELSAGAGVTVPSEGLPAGLYVVRLRDRGGADVGSARLVVR